MKKRLPRPNSSIHNEHPVASLDCTRQLRDAVAADSEELARLQGAHVLSAGDFDAPLLRQIFRQSACMELGEYAASRPADGKILSNLFFDEIRDHTRLSFNSAWLKLGGSLLNFERSTKSITYNRHAPDEVAELCSNYGDIAVVRTEEARRLQEMVPLFRVPVFNACNGTDEHPTHGIADLYTLFKWRPELLREDTTATPLTIGIFGNVARTPTLHSFLIALSAFPQAVERVILFSRVDESHDRGLFAHLAESGIRIEHALDHVNKEDSAMNTYRRCLPYIDLLYVHLEHHDEFNRLDFLDALNYFKEEVLVLNPKILNQEFSDRLNNSHHNGYFAQARGTVFVRMAMMAAVIGEK